MKMIRKIIVVGNSLGITLQDKFLKINKIKIGDLVEVDIKKIGDENG